METYEFKNKHGEFSVKVGDKIMVDDGHQFEIDFILDSVSSIKGDITDKPSIMIRTSENSYSIINEEKITEVFGNEDTIQNSPCPQCGEDMHLDSVESLSDYYGQQLETSLPQLRSWRHAKVYNLSCPNCGMSFEVREATMSERLDNYNYNHSKDNEQ